MTYEVTPQSELCNMRCFYCYQNAVRDAGNIQTQYSLDKMMATLKKHGKAFTIFGGEALMTPIEDLEKLWKFGLEQYNERAKKEKQKEGPNGVQTNGTLITPDHIKLFRKYQVHVGFSMDGPADLNRARWLGDEAKTDLGTQASQRNIEKLLRKRLPVSLILTLHRGNVGTPERLERTKQWLRDLDRRGLNSCRLHILEVDDPQVRHLELTDDENIALFLDFARFEDDLKNIRFDVFKDMENALRKQNAEVTCVWNPCDPLTTQAVQGIDGQGNMTNCGRTNKDGVAWLKADKPSRERQLALYHTPQKYGGCLGCRFFLQCNGQCPGTAIDGDWRNKSKNCEVWFQLLELIEQRILAEGGMPLSMSPDRTEREKKYLIGLFTPNNGQHGDHWDHTDGPDHQDKGPVPGKDGHGDVQHGDEHGDHTDVGLLRKRRTPQQPLVQLVRKMK